MSTGLVLEGGGLRGVFTGGVLEYFIENDLYFPYVIAVSAGACSGTSYISRQRGRNKQVTIGYIRDPRYYSYWNLIKGKDLLGMDFLFEDIPNELCPLDYETLMNAEEQLIVVATDCETGQPVYFEKNNCSDYGRVVRASSSLPFVTAPIEVDGMTLLDGGITDSIPIRKAIADGNEQNVIILTRERGYRKPIQQSGVFSKWLMQHKYGNFPKLIRAIEQRNQMYNDTVEYIEKLEDEGKVLVIRPQAAVEVKRIDRDTVKLEALYMQGYNLAQQMHEQVLEFKK